MKRYLATNDLIFKRCIGNANYPEITLGFINDILGINAREVVVENPYDIKVFQQENESGKISQTEVDVRVRMSDNSQAIAEIQVAKQHYFKERVLYYAASRYIGDYERKDMSRTSGFESKYSSLYPLYSINVLDYIQFPFDKDALRSYSLYDKKHRKCFDGFGTVSNEFGLLSLTFLELTKRINKDDHPNIKHWIDFFKGRDIDASAPQYIKQALDLSSEQNLSAKEVEMFNWIDMKEQDRIDQLAYAHDEGVEQGLHKAASQAFAEGASFDFVQKITDLDSDILKEIQAKTLSTKE